jgi:error-prone DNA polymerase
VCFCNICAHDWTVRVSRPRRFSTIDDLIRRTGARRDELAVLAEIGALNSLGHDRRGALWQIERAVRAGGALFEEGKDGTLYQAPGSRLQAPGGVTAPGQEPRRGPEPAACSLQPEVSPLHPMSPRERMTADYAGTGLTIGPHPMAMRRHDLAARAVQRAIDLPRGRNGQRVRTAGMVITRQRPGTAKGFVFLTLEDETGIINVIVRPDLFAADRMTIVGAPFLFIEGILQNIDGVTSVKAERLEPLPGQDIAVESHDFR